MTEARTSARLTAIEKRQDEFEQRQAQLMTTLCELGAQRSALSGPRRERRIRRSKHPRQVSHFDSPSEAEAWAVSACGDRGYPRVRPPPSVRVRSHAGFSNEQRKKEWSSRSP
jgi:hypothetical protein